MIVRVAHATGRGVMEVAHDSFALTRWTHWHLELAVERERIVSRMDRFDLAALLVIGRQEPKKLAQLMNEFQTSTTTAPTNREERTARALAHIEAHQRMQLVDSSDTPGGGSATR